jgi:hypothetical protein
VSSGEGSDGVEMQQGTPLILRASERSEGDALVARHCAFLGFVSKVTGTTDCHTANIGCSFVVFAHIHTQRCRTSRPGPGAWDVNRGKLWRFWTQGAAVKNESDGDAMV